MNYKALLVCFILFSLNFGDGKVHVTGIGGSFQWPLFDDWTYAYNLQHSNDVELNYTVVPGSLTNKEIVRPDPTVDYFSSIALHRNDSDLAGRQDDIQFIPFTIGSLVPIYNIPALAWQDGSPGTPQLIIGATALADIFRGRITYWNDSRIAVDNPNVVLPDEEITIILRKDNSGFTYAFQEAFKQFVPDWTYKTGNAWAKEIQNLSNAHMTVDTFGMISDCNKIQYSIGYATLAQLVTQRISLASSYALLKNLNGKVVRPTEEHVLQAQSSKMFDQYLFGNFINSSDGWPISMVAFISIRTDVSHNCSVMRELYKFIYWTQTDPNAKTRPGAMGYSGWTSELSDQIINYLKSATCEGNLILEVRHEKQHTPQSIPALLILGMILLFLSIVLGAVWQYNNTSRCSKVVVMYQAILMIGASMTYIAVIFWYFTPESTAICQTRIWLTTIGYTLILTAMFERTWQIRRVYGKVVKGNQLTLAVSGFLELGGGIAVVIILQFIIMIVWSVVDPFKRVEVDASSPFDVTFACKSENPMAWLAVEGVYFGVLLIWAIYVVYTTWSIRTFIVESRWILIAMYNILLFLALLATLLATLEYDDDLLFLTIVPFIELSTTTVIVAVYAPSVLHSLKIIVSTDSGKTRSDGLHSSVSKETADIELRD